MSYSYDNALSLLGLPNACRDMPVVKQAYKMRKRVTTGDKERAVLRSAYRLLKSNLESESETETEHDGFRSQLSCDNAIIQDDGFDVKRVFLDMNQDRPKSTSYQAILQDMKDRKSWKDQNDTYSPDAFTGFDDVDGAAPIICDGNFMFIKGRTSDQNGQNRFASTDGSAGSTIHRSAGKLTEAGISDYLQTRESFMANSDAGPRLSTRQFQDKMSKMEAARNEALTTEAMQNTRHIQQQMNRLSSQTRNALFSYDAAFRGPVS